MKRRHACLPAIPFLTFTALALSLLWAPVAHTQGKLRIAVTAFENKVASSFANWPLGDGLADMLTTELVRTGRYLVLERTAIQDVLNEQYLGQSGLVRSETAAPVGQMVGAQVIVRGVVTEFDDAASGAGGGLGYRGFEAKGEKRTARIGFDIRLIDAKSGAILASQYVAREVDTGKGEFNYQNRDLRIGGAAFNRTPLGEAARAAISDAVGFITRNTALPTATGPSGPKVIKVDGERVYVSGGANQGIRAGDRFTVFSPGEELLDPDTGISLGSSEERRGTIEIVTVREKFSIGVRTDGGGFQRGDFVRAR